MPHPALAALRARIRLAEILHNEPGLPGALVETMVPMLEPDTIPDLWTPLLAHLHPDVDEAAARSTSRQLSSEMRRRVEHSVPYWVDHDIGQIIIAAAESHPPEPLTAARIPAIHGLVVFDRGVDIAFVDLEGTFETTVITAMWWTTNTTTGHPAVWVTLFSDPTSPRDSLHPLLQAHRHVVDPFPGVSGFVPAWSTAIRVHSPHTPHPATPPTADYSDHWSHHIASTFFSLLGHALTVTTHTPTPKELRRTTSLIAPIGPPPGNTISIITLRRGGTNQPPPVDTDPDRPRRHWRVRTLVGATTGGFWRPYHTNNGVENRYILPYLAGPEGAPIVIREKVYAWRR